MKLLPVNVAVFTETFNEHLNTFSRKFILHVRRVAFPSMHSLDSAHRTARGLSKHAVFTLGSNQGILLKTT